MKNVQIKEEVKKQLGYMHPRNEIFELCVIKPEIKKSKLWGNEEVIGSEIVAGWFDDHKDVANLVKQLNKVEPESVYVSLNRCKRALRGRVDGKLRANINRTKDDEIYKLTNILIDIDPVRPSGVSSTNKEHKIAIKTAKKISKDLRRQGFPDHLIVDSGNGAHLIIKTELDNNEQNVHLIKRFLSALAYKYNTTKVKIDERVYNPGRLIKLPGTFTRKGENLRERPHRRSRILKMPKAVKRVKIEQLEKLASIVPEDSKENKNVAKEMPHLVDVKAYLKHYGMEIRKTKPYRDGKLFVLKNCLFNPNHSPGKASIFQSSEGTLYYQCFHNSCYGKHWNDARRAISGDDKLDKFYKDLPNTGSGNVIFYSTMTGAELIQRRIKETPLIKGLLEKTGSLLLVGQTGIMKSMLTLNIALNMADPPADGRLWGIYDISEAVRTLFIQSENSIYGTKSRLQLMTLEDESPEDFLKRIYFPDIRNDCRIMGNLKDKYFQETLKEMIFKTKARLIVIDPLISFHNESENDNAEIRKVLDSLTELCSITKTACVVVHHSGKEASKDVYAARGASSIVDWAGNVLLLNEANNDGNKHIKVSHVKSRNFEERPPFTLEVSGNLRFERVNEISAENKNVVVDVLKSLGGKVEDQGTFIKALVGKGVSSETKAFREINKAVKAGKIEEIEDGKRKRYCLTDTNAEK